MMQDHTIVSFAWEDFNGPWLSRQYIMTSLAKRAPVLYITPEQRFDAVMAGLRDPQNRKPFLARQTRIRDNLVHLDPGGVFPRFFESRTTLNRLTRRLRMNQINRTVKSLDWPEKKILYVWNPDFHDVFGQMDETVSIFHCVDYFPHYFPEGSGPRKKSIRDLDTCLRKADIVLTTCGALEEKLAEHVDRKYTRLLHGVDIEAFNAGPAEETPAELKDIPRPRLAHIGRINNKIDVELLATIAERNPQWSIVLMGPIVSGLSDATRAGLARLENLPNAHLLPGKRPEELPAFFNAIDVGLMAYHMAFWVPYGFPLKFFEFLGAGKPMICSPLESMKEFSEFVGTADSADTWIGAIEKALAVDSPGIQAQRKELAARSSWDHRAGEIIAHIENHHGLGPKP
jgi:hypothetical protein